MTFSGTTNTSNTLKFGAANAQTQVKIETQDNNASIPGDIMRFTIGDAGDGTNSVPGSMLFNCGMGTGNVPGGNYIW